MILTAQTYHLKDLTQLTQEWFSSTFYANNYEFEKDNALDYLRRCMVYPTIEVAVAEWSGRAVGFSIVSLTEMPWCQNAMAFIEFLYVRPGYSEQEFAHGLLDHQVNWARKNSAREINSAVLDQTAGFSSDYLDQQQFSPVGQISRKVLTNETV
jgi:GNAT superfamily N-acetyltransferase